MAVKKSEIYNRIWQACDVLRGGMDPSQYKDYVLSILFIKYVSDKYAGHPYAAIKVPPGSSFNDLKSLKGKSDIGDQINKKIIAPIANENKLGGFPDFADAGRFGSGKQMVDTLTGLVATFEHPDLDFSKNRADGDDILGDAYEFLMRHFATESGKAKGQFYTPAEVSRVMAQIVGIRNPKTTNQTTVYDPTCGSGSLLIKVADEAGARVTLYGQEKDGSTAGLARMNLILHDYPGAVIHPGQSTLSDPAFIDGERLKTFDYVVANPPFSDKRWRQGMDPNELKPGFALKVIDASRGFVKDGPKNRLREMDVHRIVDVFRRGQDAPKYARLVGYDLIEANGFNLNLPRYIDGQPPEDRQDIAGHLQGGIPERDVAALGAYWAVCPSLEKALFRPNRPGYLDLAIEPQAVRAVIHRHREFQAFTQGVTHLFAEWRGNEAEGLKSLVPGFHPKSLIAELSERLLKHYQGRPLIDAYAVYQHLMAYWAETMQDDAYLIAADGWKAATTRILETKKGKDGKDRLVDKGWACDLVPKELLVAYFFSDKAAAIADAEAERERVAADVLALEEEHGNEDGLFSELIEDGEVVVTEKGAKVRLKEIKGDKTALEEARALGEWLTLVEREKALKRAVRDAEAALDDLVYGRYPKLTEDELKALVVDDKWMAALEARIVGETTRAAEGLTRRVRELGERYGKTLPALAGRVAELEGKVMAHLAHMDFV